MVDIRTSCHAARLAVFLCPQKHWNALIFRGAHMYITAITNDDKLSQQIYSYLIVLARPTPYITWPQGLDGL